MAQAAQVDWDLKALGEIFSAALEEGLLFRRPEVHMWVDESPTVEITYIKSKVAIWYDRAYDIYVARAEPILEREALEQLPLAFAVSASGKTPREAIAALRERVKELAEDAGLVDAWLRLEGGDNYVAELARDAVGATLASIHDLIDALKVKKEG